MLMLEESCTAVNATELSNCISYIRLQIKTIRRVYITEDCTGSKLCCRVWGFWKKYNKNVINELS